MYIKYTIQAAPQVIRSIVRNDVVSIFEPGTEVIVSLHPGNIMSYPHREVAPA